MEVINLHDRKENNLCADGLSIQEISSSSEINMVPESSECTEMTVTSSSEVSSSHIENLDMVSSSVENLEISNSAISSSSSILDVSSGPVANSTLSKDVLVEGVETACISSYDSIMSVCSTAAEHIKQTINQVLKSRDEDVQKLETSYCPISLQDNLREKIKDFERTVEMANAPSKSSSAVGADENISDLNSNSESQLFSDVSQKSVQEDASTSCNNEADPLVSTPSLPGDNEELQIKRNNHLQSKVPTVSQNSSLEEEKSKKSQKNSTVKRKGEKSVDQVLKSFNNCATTEEKLLALCRKHIEVLDDMKSSENRLKQNDRNIVVLLREKEQLQADHNRIILAKSRLESLCRELQRQNKAIKEESLLRIREEEEKRKDVSNKFQTTLNEISAMMKDNSERNDLLKDENGQLANKLKLLVDHYDMWEKHMKKLGHQKELEVQLANAKLAKSNLQLRKETEDFLREKQRILLEMRHLQDKCTELTSNELKLRTELSVYTSKYDEFQNVLSKSNEVFATFKTDMETTSKKIKKLEKETNIWKQKWENSNSALLDMVADKQKRDKELVNAHQRILTLEKLCRALQAERNDLQKQVKELSNQDSTTTLVKNGDCDLPGTSISQEEN